MPRLLVVLHDQDDRCIALDRCLAGIRGQPQNRNWPLSSSASSAAEPSRFTQVARRLG
jgi:hypothetical protein